MHVSKALEKESGYNHSQSILALNSYAQITEKGGTIQRNWKDGKQLQIVHDPVLELILEILLVKSEWKRSGTQQTEIPEQ